jgi:N-acyl-D-amino-acid deacylase
VAQRAGVQITADLYPYPAGQVMLATLLPAWVHEGGAQAALLRLANPGDRARMRDHLEDPAGLWGACGAQNIVYWSLPSGRTELLGKDAASVAQAAGKGPVDFALDLLREENLGVTVVCKDQSEEIVERLLVLPQVNVCAGGLPGGRPHPRAWGAFPRVLARYVREKGILTLEQAIRKMTGLAADTFGLDDFGYVVEGKRANLVVFDPATIRDTATFEAPESYPDGIRYVLVGGKIAVRDGRPTGERAGRVARRRRS